MRLKLSNKIVLRGHTFAQSRIPTLNQTFDIFKIKFLESQYRPYFVKYENVRTNLSTPTSKL